MTDPPARRIGALDMLRGVTVAAMIVVNNPGNWSSVYPPLTHAAWHGVTLADLVFPAFVFIMGMAMALAPVGSRPPLRAPYSRILSRTFLLLLMGLTLNATAAWPHLAAMRIPGVLQRLALTYTAAALILRHLRGPRMWFACAALLGVHWAVLLAGGSLEPDANVGAALDRLVFGSHLLSPSGDPEGLLGLLSSTATALLGAGVGGWLFSGGWQAARDTAAVARPAWFRLAGAASVALVGGVLWSLMLPLNKALWTGSFALLASGWTMLALAACLWLDGTAAKRVAAPFVWLGTNPLAVYFLSELTTSTLQREWLPWGTAFAAPKELIYWGCLVPMVGDAGGAASSLAYALLYALLWVGVAGLLQRRGVRWRV